MNPEANRIWLDLAFLKVVAHFEQADCVSTDDRIATGRIYRRKFTIAPQPARKGRQWEAPQTLVPRVPDLEQLKALLEDEREDEIHSKRTTSAAERGACRAHNLLHNALRSGRVKAWAEEVICSDDKTEALTHSDRAIKPDLWNACAVDYYHSACHPDGDDWETRSGGHLVRGYMLLRNIALDEDALEAQLRGSVEAELRLDPADGQEIWTIIWRGVAIQIPCAGAEALSRGMRIIAVLLQHSGKSISCCLLEGLKRRKVDRKSKTTKNVEVSRLRGLIDPVCQRFFEGSITLKAAGDEVGKLLAGRNPAAIPDEATFHNLAYDAVTNSLNAVKEHVRKIGGPLGSEVESHMTKSIASKRRSSRYDPGGEPVMWKWVHDPGTRK